MCQKSLEEEECCFSLGLDGDDVAAGPELRI